MKKNEKRGIIISLIIVLMGLIGVVYTTVIKDSVEEPGYMYSLGFTYLVVGILFAISFIRLSRNKQKSDEHENMYEDERINSNKDRACAVTFKVIIWTSVIADFIVTFFLRDYEGIANALNILTGFSILVYLVAYFFISKNN